MLQRLNWLVLGLNRIIKLKVVIKLSFNGRDALSQIGPTLCDYEQLILIGYNYNQFEINDVS